MTHALAGSMRALMLALAVGLAGLASAQAQTNYTQSQLDAFVVAAFEVDRLMQVWIPRIEAAESQEIADELKGAARAEFIQAIEGTAGLPYDTFQEIDQAAQRDQRLAERLGAIYRLKYPK